MRWKDLPVAVLMGSALLMGCADTESKADDWEFAEQGAKAGAAAQAGDEISAEGIRDDGYVADRPESNLYDFSAAIRTLEGAHWTEQMVGCVGSYVWHAFNENPSYEMFEQTLHMDEGNEDVSWRVYGTWSVDEHGTVEWASERDGTRRVNRRTLALARGEIASLLTYAYGDRDEHIVWPQGAFAARTRDLTEYRSVHYSAQDSEDYANESGMTVDLKLGSSLGEVAASATCSMTFTATRVTGEQLSHDFACSTQPFGEEGNLQAIVAEGMSSDYWETAETWRQKLETDGFYEQFEDQYVADELRMATVPFVVFDPENPEVLIRFGGYSVFGTAAP